jgi:hypothetical protein
MEKSVHHTFGGGRARSKRRKTLKRKNPKRKTPKRKTPKRKNQKKRRSSRKAGARMFKCLEPDPGQAKRDAAEKKAKDDREQWKKDIKEAIAYNKSQANKREKMARRRGRWSHARRLPLISTDYDYHPDKIIPGAYYPPTHQGVAMIPSGWDWHWWWVPEDEKERLTRIAYGELYGDDEVDVEYPPENFKDVRETHPGDWLAYPSSDLTLKTVDPWEAAQTRIVKTRMPADNPLALKQGALENRTAVPETETVGPTYGNLTEESQELIKEAARSAEGRGGGPGTGTITSEPAPEPSSEETGASGAALAEIENLRAEMGLSKA